VEAKARAPRASAFSDSSRVLRVLAAEIQRAAKQGGKNMETHAEREKIHPRCKRAHVRAPEVTIKLLWVKKCFKFN